MSEPSPVSGISPEKNFAIGNLQVKIFADRAALGRAAAFQAATSLKQAIRENGIARAIFAAAPSQNELLAGLSKDASVDWQKVIAFHLDEYLGLAGDAPQSFQTYLKEHLFDRVRPGVVNFLQGATANPNAETGRYSNLLAEARLDLACIGIGENGHI